MRSAAMIYLLAFQLAIAPAFAQTPPSDKLRIIPLEGEGGINNVGQRTGRDLAVRVEDEKNQPVAGAAVSFTLPSQGPSGSFASGGNTTTVTTDEQGRAVVRGLRPNQVAGTVEIRINVSHQGLTGKAVMTQFNMMVPSAKKSGGHGGRIALIVLLAGAAAGAAGVAATRGGKSSNTTPSVTVPSIGINPGTPTVGPPQ